MGRNLKCQLGGRWWRWLCERIGCHSWALGTNFSFGNREQVNSLGCQRYSNQKVEGWILSNAWPLDNWRPLWGFFSGQAGGIYLSSWVFMNLSPKQNKKLFSPKIITLIQRLAHFTHHWNSLFCHLSSSCIGSWLWGCGQATQILHSWAICSANKCRNSSPYWSTHFEPSVFPHLIKA